MTNLSFHRILGIVFLAIIALMLNKEPQATESKEDNIYTTHLGAVAVTELKTTQKQELAPIISRWREVGP